MRVGGRFEFRVTLGLLLVAGAILCVPFHVRPENFVVDDGYFYPQIARYIARGEGSTFNGVMPTNGYHPLWMLVCVAGAWVTQKSLPLLQVLTAFQDVLTLGSVAIFFAMVRAAGKRGALLGCAPILFFGTVLGIWRLLESNAALLLQLVVLAVAVPVFPWLQARIGRWKDPLLGVLLGLTVLCRLDLIFFAVLVLAYSMVGRKGTRLRAFLLPGFVATFVVSPYLALNFRMFHHLEPISGAIKSSFPHPHRWHLAQVTIPVIAAALLNGVWLVRRWGSMFAALCLLTSASALVHLAFSLTFGDISPWYMTTGYLSVSLCLVWMFDGLPEPVYGMRWLEPAVGLGLFVVFLGLASIRVLTNLSQGRIARGMVTLDQRYREPKRALAMKLRATFPPGSRFFIFDAPGGVAYDSGMSIVPVDGLVGDYAYSESLTQEGPAAYAAEHEIEYLIAPYVRAGQRYDRLFLIITREGDEEAVAFKAPLTRRYAGTIVLKDADLLFQMPEISPDMEWLYPEVGVWRIGGDGDGRSR